MWKAPSLVDASEKQVIKHQEIIFSVNFHLVIHKNEYIDNVKHFW